MPLIHDVAQAAQFIRAGKLCAFATETVYGLGADATNNRAVAKIFNAKGRPQFNPLISHVADLKMATQLGRFNDTALALAHAFWPGPLTLVVARQDNCPVSLLTTAGLDTLGLRVPDHPIALDLLKAARCPIAAPSANISGRISPTRSQDVIADFSQDDIYVLDGGPAIIGLESTIVAVHDDQPLLLRPGAITQEDLTQALGQEVATHLPALNADGTMRPTAPGQLASHYAPTAAMRLNASTRSPGEAWLGFGGGALQDPFMRNLSPSGNLVEAAANLFRFMRELDALSPRVIAVAPIPQTGIGVAINDRLFRAAATKTE